MSWALAFIFAATIVALYRPPPPPGVKALARREVEDTDAPVSGGGR